MHELVNGNIDSNASGTADILKTRQVLLFLVVRQGYIYIGILVRNYRYFRSRKASARVQNTYNLERDIRIIGIFAFEDPLPRSEIPINVIFPLEL